MLCQHGIDIWCFLEEKTDGRVRYIPKILLDKPVSTVCNVMNFGKDVVFISVHGENSALGTEDVDFYDYYGYRRNKQFFLLNDYIDIAYSNLVHVLCGKKIFLAGDKMLCSILTEYLETVEEGNVSVQYIEIAQWNVQDNNNQNLFVVCPWNGVADIKRTPELWKFREQLRRITDISYSKYFSRRGAFVFIDAYLNKHREKYAQGRLIPQGILLGAVPGVSGNVLVRGLLDGHPNILQILYDNRYYDFSNNLFWYCICMAWKQNKKEGTVDELSTLLPDYESFEDTIGEMQALNGEITSQEIFLMYHKAYLEHGKHMDATDMSQKLIYWEPHNTPKTEMSLLARWLDSGKVGGYILATRRNNIVWYGSRYKVNMAESDANHNYWAVNFMPGLEAESVTSLKCWEEIIIRFEDLKLHPKAELLKFCKRVGIPWSDTLMHTTYNGNEWVYEGDVVDFDIKPVFNPYETFLSEFDRLRLSIVSAPYQKKYGYPYEDSLKFSRKELQEMFLKPFRFLNSLQFETDTDKRAYYLYYVHFLVNELWKVRKHAILNDIVPEFDAVEIGRSKEEEQKRKEHNKDRRRQEALKHLYEFIKRQDKLIFYGIGKDCVSLLEHLDEPDREKILFCDQKALQEECIFYGKRVFIPQDLRHNYYDYKILVTSSCFYKEIQRELENIGVDQKRIECNTVQLWK